MRIILCVHMICQPTLWGPRNQSRYLFHNSLIFHKWTIYLVELIVLFLKTPRWSPKFSTTWPQWQFKDPSHMPLSTTCMEIFDIFFLGSWTWEVNLCLFDAQSQSLSIDAFFTTQSKAQVKEWEHNEWMVADSSVTICACYIHAQWCALCATL